MGLFEVVGIASILPFMQIAAQPEAIQENEWLRWIYQVFGFDNEQNMLVAGGITVLVLLTLSNVLKTFTLWLQQKFSWDVAHELGARLFRVYLAKPYGYFLTHNTSEMLTNLVIEAGRVTTGILLPLCEFIAQMTVSILIFCLLVYANPQVAFVIFCVLGLAYGLVYLTKRNLLNRLGEERILTNRLKFLYLKETLMGIKTFRVYGVESFFYGRFLAASKRHSTIQPKIQLVTIIPRYLMETLAFGGIILFLVVLISSGQKLDSVLPLLSLYVFAGYRLMPSLQRVFAGAIKVRHHLPVIDAIKDDLRANADFFEEKNIKNPIPKLQHQAVFNQVTFRYEATEQVVLSNLNIKIPKGKTTAFVGTTGAGKTTLVDMMVGLLHPQVGDIQIDSVELSAENAITWRKQIAYVPQEVFLFDDSILNNVALGETRETVDMERLKAVLKIANIDEFIQHELPEKYETIIGEEGVRLSGGQRQRLGLARALYRQPNVLILDEATSALDSITEANIIDALQQNASNLTIIVIAHRLSTVRHADCIYLLEKGQIIAEGNYEKLLQKSDIFREMVELG